jgi:hypothetical protein
VDLSPLISDTNNRNSGYNYRDAIVAGAREHESANHPEHPRGAADRNGPLLLSEPTGEIFGKATDQSGAVLPRRHGDAVARRRCSSR